MKITKEIDEIIKSEVASRKHLTLKAVYTSRYVIRNRLKGLCINCKRPLMLGSAIYCEKHYKKRKQTRDNWLKQKKCLDCGGDTRLSPSKIRCAVCLDKNTMSHAING